jgi:hypothetical protein
MTASLNKVPLISIPFVFKTRFYNKFHLKNSVDLFFLLVMPIVSILKTVIFSLQNIQTIKCRSEMCSRISAP